MSKLLKEAIADAKAVRETALANARLALEEAFAPRLQSMLTKKLKEEELEGEESELEVSDEVEEDLNELALTLQKLGAVVHRPKPFDLSTIHSSPFWFSNSL